MATKVRTQLQLERRQYEQLKRLAYERNQSLSAVVRELLNAALGSRGDESRRHDSYQYGQRRKPRSASVSKAAVEAARRFRAKHFAGLEFTVSSAALIRRSRSGRSVE